MTNRCLFKKAYERVSLTEHYIRSINVAFEGDYNYPRMIDLIWEKLVRSLKILFRNEAFWLLIEVDYFGENT